MPPRATHRRLVTAALAAVLAAGVASCAAHRAQAPVTTSAWDAVEAQIRPDGTVPVAAALQAFSLLVAPMPGVAVPSGTRDALPFDATSAIRWTAADWDDLTPAQQAVARPYVASLVSPSTPGPSATTAAYPRRAPNPLQGDVDDALHNAEQVESDHLGRLGMDVSVFYDSFTLPGAAAYTIPSSDGSTCEIHMSPGMSGYVSDYGPAYLRMVMAHELFHCYEFVLMGHSMQRYATEPAWLMEGAVQWVGQEVEPSDAIGQNWVWRAYLAVPWIPLFRRAYSAIGFYAHLDENGTDPWRVFPAMFLARGNEAALTASGARNVTFLDSYASSTVRVGSYGRPWETTGPGITGDAADPTAVTVSAVRPYSTTVAYLADVQLRLTLNAPEITFTLPAQGRLKLPSPAPDLLSADANGQTYCTISSCACPDNPGPPALGGSKAILAVTGYPGPGASHIAIVGHDLPCTPSESGATDGTGTGDQPPPPAECAKLPTLGPPSAQVVQATNDKDGVTSVTCYWASPKKGGPDYGWIIVLTFPSPAAAAAFYDDNATGTPRSGFGVPLRQASTCHQFGKYAFCQRGEISLKGNRMDEVEDKSWPPDWAWPPPAHTDAVMRELLADT